MAKPTDRRPSDPLSGPCIPAVDLTAFAHGELPEWHRAEISRHLLRCGACSASASGTGSLFSRLRALDDDGDAWRGEIADALTARASRRRLSLRAMFVGTAAAAAVLVAGFATTRLRATNDASIAPAASLEAVPAARLPLDRDETALLAAQRADGRWPAGSATADEASTGLALLALAARRPLELRDGAVGRAAASATTWLLSRQRSDGGFGRAGLAASSRDEAVATAALLEVYAVTGDTSLRDSVDRAVRGLARRALSDDARNDSGSRWTRLALERARSLGWGRMDRAIERVGSTFEPTSDSRPARWIAAVGGMSYARSSEGAAGSAVEHAIRVLRRGDSS